ncbi:unnamed protein product [Cunninghamella blakesleeana]
MTDNTSWSIPNKVDPFEISSKTIESSSSFSSSWYENNTQEIPKWNIQTDKERLDQQKAIQAMESKLKNIKHKQNNYSSMKKMDQHILEANDNDNSDDDDDNIDYGIDDQNEGLHLLWQERYTAEGLDDALKHQKKENQYISHPLFYWVSNCCCFVNPSS